MVGDLLHWKDQNKVQQEFIILKKSKQGTIENLFY